MFNNFDLHQQAHWTHLQTQQLNDERMELAQSVLASIRNAVDGYFSEVTRVKGDGDLTSQGRDNRLREAASKTQKQLDGLTISQIKQLDERIAETENSLARAAAGGGDEVRLMIEARAAASTIDPLLLRTQYILLCQSGADDLSCRALESGPAFGRLLSNEVIEEGRQIRAARISPDLSEELRQVRELRASIKAAAAAAYRELATYAPDGIDRTVKALA